MSQKIGKASMKPEQPVYILNSGSIVGTKEGQGPLGLLFDVVGEDDLFGCETWEEAESHLQKDAVYLALSKAGVKPEEVSFLFAGDLLGQSIATSFGISSYQIPLLGVYGACSTCGESLTLGAMAIAGGFADRVVCVTSSHFASAEKEFRFPLEYGNQRPLSASWTVTGSGAFVLGNKQAMEEGGSEPEAVTGGRKRARACITGMTVGKIVDYGLKDSMNMGACMAPAAASRNFSLFIPTYFIGSLQLVSTTVSPSRSFSSITYSVSTQSVSPLFATAVYADRSVSSAFS